MMIDTGSLIALGFALAIAVAVPGPGIAAVIARALKSGLKTTCFMIPGIILGDLVYLTLAVFGLALIAQTFATLFLILKIAGALYLAYLAWTFWTAPIADFTVKDTRDKDESPFRVFLSALLITLGNPKPIAFYMALLPTFVDLQAVTLVGYFELVALMIVTIGGIVFAYAALADRMRAIFRRPGPQRIMQRSAAAVMAGAAVSIATR
ncbi:LysE family translocator [Coralliovum pocilloporae]|uniref:LysE family translocator n=1 Tax=Coralliovum pocilloporae TaxID=3066369 RepID=UPI003307479B